MFRRITVRYRERGDRGRKREPPDPATYGEQEVATKREQKKIKTRLSMANSDRKEQNEASTVYEPCFHSFFSVLSRCHLNKRRKKKAILFWRRSDQNLTQFMGGTSKNVSAADLRLRNVVRYYSGCQAFAAARHFPSVHGSLTSRRHDREAFNSYR